MRCRILLAVIFPSVAIALAMGKAFAQSPQGTSAPAAAISPAPATTPTPVPAPAKTWTKAQAKKILKIAEEIRSPEKAEALVDLKTVRSDGSSTYDMKILRSTEQRAYIEFLGPAEERGRRMLAKGRNYWATFPDSRRVLPISRREMIGDSVFAVADIFQIDTEADYDATIVGEETAGSVKMLKVDCTAKHADAPYHRIEYWVEEGTSFPVKARFYGVSGKHMKTLYIEARKHLAGRERPETVRMDDEVTKGRASWWKTKAMTPVSIPDNVFTTDYLKGGR